MDGHIMNINGLHRYGRVVLTYLSDFIIMKKKNLVLTINQIDSQKKKKLLTKLI